MAARLLLRAVCVVDPLDSPTEARYSTAVFLRDPELNEVTIPIEEGAVAVEACFDAPPVGDLEFRLQRRGPDGVLVDDSLVASVAPEPAPSTCFPRVVVPRPANVMR